MRNMTAEIPQANQLSSPTLTELALEVRKNGQKIGQNCHNYSHHLRNTKSNGIDAVFYRRTRNSVRKKKFFLAKRIFRQNNFSDKRIFGQ